MSVENETAGTHAASRAETEVAPAAPAANPVPLGLITFIPAGITLGLWLVGYLDTTALPGGMIPIVSFSAGLFLLVASAWAARQAANSVAAIFGVFSAFWLSFGFLLMALNNGWIVNAGASSPAEAALTTAQVSNIQAAYLLSFSITFILLTLATLRLPIMFTVGFVFVDITFVLAYLGVALGNASLFPLAGIATFIFTAVFAYILFSEFGSDLGGKPMAMGNPIQK